MSGSVFPHPWRRIVLGVLLAAAAWLALFGDKTPSSAAGGVSQPVARAVSSATVVPPAVLPRSGAPSGKGGKPVPAVDLLALRPRDLVVRKASSSPVDLFAPRSWAPPVAVPASEPVAAPVAPPLPYTYLGKKQEAGQWEVYLGRNDVTYVVRQGTVVEGTYLVEAISPPTLTLKYRPLDQAQTLAIGE